MKANACHIRIGDKGFCQCDMPPGAFAEAAKRGLSLSCRQPNGADAVAFVHMLQDLGVADAAVAEGLCEWDPEDRELRKLNRHQRASATA